MPDGTFTKNILIEQGDSSLANPYRAKKSDLIGGVLYSLLETAGSGPLWLALINVASEVTSIYSIGVSASYTSNRVYFSSTIILISCYDGFSHKVFKVDLGTLEYFEILFPSDFTLSDVFFVNPSGNDLDYIYVGKTNSVSDGVKT